jgi:Rps23 Pro-64 3,4-dihydroxylase Tpa1-like proline 4-hydroxylase
MILKTSDWLSPQLLDRKVLKSLALEYAHNTPFSHLLIKNFLQETQAKKLQIALKKEPFEKKQSDLFSLSQTQDFATTQQKDLQELYKLFQSKEFANIISQITGVKIKAGTIDMNGSLYEDTDFLLCHDDQLQGRKVAYIYYLSQDFKESDGGALTLLADKEGHPSQVIKQYPPLYNSVILFTVSQKSWHEVLEVLSDKKRYAIGGWLY